MRKASTGDAPQICERSVAHPVNCPSRPHPCICSQSTVSRAFTRTIAQAKSSRPFRPKERRSSSALPSGASPANFFRIRMGLSVRSRKSHPIRGTRRTRESLAEIAGYANGRGREVNPNKSDSEGGHFRRVSIPVLPDGESTGLVTNIGSRYFLAVPRVSHNPCCFVTGTE